MSDDEQDDIPDLDDFTVVEFRMFNHNWERLYSTAAMNGEDLEVALNRATKLYELVHRAEPGEVVSWQDRDGHKRSLLILPALLRRKDKLSEQKLLRTGSVSLLCAALILLLITFVLDSPAAAKWIGIAWVLGASWIVYFVYRRWS